MLRRWAPLAAAVAVVAIVAAVSLVFSQRGAAGDPPPLRLAAGSSGDAAIAADAPMAEGKRAAGGSSFVLSGTLPDGPDEARAHELPRGAAEEDDVSRLAAALGVKGDPKRVERAWQLAGLRVEDAAGNPWSMSMYSYACGADVPVASGGTVSSDGAVSSDGTVSSEDEVSSEDKVSEPRMPECLPGLGAPGTTSSSGSGSAGSVGSAGSDPATEPDAAPPSTPCPDNARCAQPGFAPAPPSPGPTADVNAARRAATAVLAKLGLDDADVAVEGAGEHAFVRADPRIDGLPTSGYTTYLEVDAEGSIASGGGYLARPSAGPSYPLVSAKAAFENLPEQPRALMACPETIGSEPACPQPEPAQVTGAELGLMLTALADEEAALLPAWLFTVKDWPMPLAQPAIEPRFLTLPEDKPIQVDPIDPGLVDPPQQVDPAEPPKPAEPPSSGDRSLFSFDSVFPTDDPKTIIVQYGDSSSCPHANVKPLVKESADTVLVMLEADTQSAERACTADYRQQLLKVTLEGPLGDRKVVDGSRNEPVAVDRTCSRPMGGPPAPKNCAG